MILITGGAYQGKREYAERLYSLSEADFTDGRSCGFDDILTAKCLVNFHIFVKRVLESGGDIFSMYEKMVMLNPDLIVITDEIGAGIIPLDRNERIWRETVGKICCKIAEKSSKVIRINCGLPLILKES